MYRFFTLPTWLEAFESRQKVGHNSRVDILVLGTGEKISLTPPPKVIRKRLESWRVVESQQPLHTKQSKKKYKMVVGLWEEGSPN